MGKAWRRLVGRMAGWNVCRELDRLVGGLWGLGSIAVTLGGSLAEGLVVRLVGRLVGTLHMRLEGRLLEGRLLERLEGRLAQGFGVAAFGEVSWRVASRFVTLSLIGWCITRWWTCRCACQGGHVANMQNQDLGTL